MRAVIITENIRIDILVRDLMGTEHDGSVELFLTANPGLADKGPYVDAGTLITVPERPPKPLAPVVNPWD